MKKVLACLVRRRREGQRTGAAIRLLKSANQRLTMTRQDYIENIHIDGALPDRRHKPIPRAMISFIISFEPAKIRLIRASVYMRLMRYSSM